jgi:hypothetical protein
MSVVVDFSQPLTEVAAPPAPTVPQLPLWRLSVDQYHEMVRHGILTEGDEVELLNGLLVAKMTKNTAHHVAKLLVQGALAKVIPEGWYVDSQDAITLATSEPEPDVMVVRGQPRDYLAHHPLAGELALVVEVSDSSLQHDQGFKKAIYAAAGIRPVRPTGPITASGRPSAGQGRCRQSSPAARWQAFRCMSFCRESGVRWNSVTWKRGPR